MSFLEIYAVAGLVILGMMATLWVVSLVLRDSSIVDIFWGLGFVFAVWIYHALTPEGLAPRKLLLSVLVSLWGLRLSLHILRRNRGKGEDFRYAQWRQSAGRNWWWRSWFKVFLLQGLLLWIISAPLLAAQIPSSPGRLVWLDAAAILLWTIGFLFETIGDLQLARFKDNKAYEGKVLDTGLWRYTRHPNYFGDALQWWAYYLIASAAGAFWTAFSPLLMTLLLLRVSGVTLLEQSLVKNKPGYDRYMRTTNAFIPWFPKIQG